MSLHEERKALLLGIHSEVAVNLNVQHLNKPKHVFKLFFVCVCEVYSTKGTVCLGECSELRGR